MKIRFLKNVTVDVETRSGEVSDKGFYRWDELRVLEVFNPTGSPYATVETYEGVLLLNVPVDSFEQLKEEKRELTL